MSHLLPLTLLPAALMAHTGRRSPNYRKLWLLAVEGGMPAEQVGGRWYVRRDAVPAIARVLGMVDGHAESRPIAA